jgi:RimJ/RimL family protein N-acetyltransferase
MSQPSISIRGLSQSDVSRLAEIANDRRIANMLRDYFPHPYSTSDAEGYISYVSEQDPLLNLGIFEGDLLVGVCGGNLLTDVHRHTTEIGYWLGAEAWGRGIASKALALLVNHYFDHTDTIRLQAHVFSNNPASEQVLIKNGFILEGVCRKHVYKNGVYLDALLYALLKDD